MLDCSRKGSGLGQVAFYNLGIPDAFSVSKTFLSIPAVTKMTVCCIVSTKRQMSSSAVQEASAWV